MSLLSSLSFSLFLLFQALSGLRAQQPLGLAHFYYQEGLYYEAATEYKRYIFFEAEKDPPELSATYSQLGFSLANEGRWAEAFKSFNFAIQTSGDDQEKDERRLALAVAYQGQQNFSAAKLILLKLEMFANSKDIRSRALFFHVVCSTLQGDWNDAKDAFLGYEKMVDSPAAFQDQAEILTLLDEASKAARKSPALAKWLSTFLPGSGQIYCGQWLDGLNALLINTLMVTLLVRDLGLANYGDVAFNSFFLFNRFYQGNRLNAERQAKSYNERVNQNIKIRLLNLLRTR